MASEQQADKGTISPNDRLIKTLERCFSDLMDKQEEQSEKRAHNYITRASTNTPEGFKKPSKPSNQSLPPPTRRLLSGAHTRLWPMNTTRNSNKNIAQTWTRPSLHSAGLFSAVDSAFIIQIQPDIQPHGTPLVILVAQNLLYVSLGSTLLAALLAVLGKQWLMIYMAAGERGTIEARGLERQRKLDGLRKWKFDTVMQLFPLLLQFGLFLFSTALSTYLWSIHLSLALVVLSFTAIGFVSYTALLISAVASPDSPFQTPLAPLVARLLPRTLWMKSKRFVGRVAAYPWAFIQCAYAGAQHLVRAHMKAHSGLPFFENHDTEEMTKKPILASLFERPFPPPSPEVPAVSWVLETSTDPRTVVAAAEMVIDLQWPGGMDVRPQLLKLLEEILLCFECHPYYPGHKLMFWLDSIRDGMSTDAMHLGRAYCTLCCVQSLYGDPGHRDRWLGEFPHYDSVRQGGDERLNDVLGLLGSPENPDFGLSLTDPIGTTWALNVLTSRLHPDSVPQLGNFLENFAPVIPNLDATSFADYLFCILTLLSPSSNYGIIWKDKSRFIESLMEYLFDTLASNIRSSLISMETAANTINTTTEIILRSEHNLWHANVYHFVIYRFCGSLPRREGWIDVVLAAVSFPLTRVLGDPSRPLTSQNGDWVYEALDCIDATAGKDKDRCSDRNITGVAILLTALLYYDVPAKKKHIHVLLRALSFHSHGSRSSAFLLVRDDQFGWFQDEQLQPIIQGASTWSSLMRVALSINALSFTESCICMGSKLVQMDYWKPHVLAELCSWIRIFFRADSLKDTEIEAPTKAYNSVLEKTCQIGYKFGNDRERALGLSYQVLCNIWRDFKIATLENIPTALPWLHCASVVVSDTHSFARLPLSSRPILKRPFVSLCGTLFFKLHRLLETR
ncbi:hypothetical protein DFH06DRAFT_140035 [Mycena polygramma]|nr:hypothetical protein DFH06DRAFT_140035 [Mycena polygramma]